MRARTLLVAQSPQERVYRAQQSARGGETLNMNWLQGETNVAGFDVPILAEEQGARDASNAQGAQRTRAAEQRAAQAHRELAPVAAQTQARHRALHFRQLAAQQEYEHLSSNGLSLLQPATAAQQRHPTTWTTTFPGCWPSCARAIRPKPLFATRRCRRRWEVTLFELILFAILAMS